jgi:hypothetical protein
MGLIGSGGKFLVVRACGCAEGHPDADQAEQTEPAAPAIGSMSLDAIDASCAGGRLRRQPQVRLSRRLPGWRALDGLDWAATGATTDARAIGGAARPGAALAV